MPQFRSPYSGPVATEYWKGVDQGQPIGIRKHPFSQNARNVRNQRSFRHEIGSIDYDDCYRDDLMSFARSKRLDIPTKASR